MRYRRAHVWSQGLIGGSMCDHRGDLKSLCATYGAKCDFMKFTKPPKCDFGAKVKFMKIHEISRTPQILHFFFDPPQKFGPDPPKTPLRWEICYLQAQSVNDEKTEKSRNFRDPRYGPNSPRSLLTLSDFNSGLQGGSRGAPQNPKIHKTHFLRFITFYVT